MLQHEEVFSLNLAGILQKRALLYRLFYSKWDLHLQTEHRPALRRFKTRIWARHLYQKLFIDSINQLRSSFHTIRRHFMCSFFMIKHLSGFRWEPDVTHDIHNNKLYKVYNVLRKEKLCDKLKSSFASSCVRGPCRGSRLPGNTLVLV